MERYASCPLLWEMTYAPVMMETIQVSCNLTDSIYKRSILYHVRCFTELNNQFLINKQIQIDIIGYCLLPSGFESQKINHLRKHRYYSTELTGIPIPPELIGPTNCCCCCCNVGTQFVFGGLAFCRNCVLTFGLNTFV